MFFEVFAQLCEGFAVTLEVFALTLAFSIPLGLVVTFGSISKFKPLAYLVRGFVWIIRGTPLMLQLFLVYYGPGLLGLPSVREPMLAVVIAFVVNYACYFSEIYRGGIEAIPKGQYEAGEALGMTKSEIFFKVVLLQVLKRIIAPMSNEIITLVKDTSLANTIAVAEIIRVAKNLTGQYGVNIVVTLLYSGLFYLVFVGLLSLLFARLEKKTSFFKV